MKSCLSGILSIILLNTGCKCKKESGFPGPPAAAKRNVKAANLKRQLLVLLFITCSVCAGAQRFYVKAGAGYLSDTHLREALTRSFFLFVFLPDIKIKTSGIYHIDILSQTKIKNFSVGISYATEHLCISQKVLGSSYTISENTNSFLATGLYSHDIKDKLAIYASSGLGVKTIKTITTGVNSSETEYETKFAWYLNAGFSYGKRVKGFLETGYGCKGLLSGGIIVTF